MLVFTVSQHMDGQSHCHLVSGNTAMRARANQTFLLLLLSEVKQGVPTVVLVAYGGNIS